MRRSAGPPDGRSRMGRTTGTILATAAANWTSRLRISPDRVTAPQAPTRTPRRAADEVSAVCRRPGGAAGLGLRRGRSPQARPEGHRRPLSAPREVPRPVVDRPRRRRGWSPTRRSRISTQPRRSRTSTQPAPLRGAPEPHRTSMRPLSQGVRRLVTPAAGRSPSRHLTICGSAACGASPPDLEPGLRPWTPGSRGGTPGIGKGRGGESIATRLRRVVRRTPRKPPPRRPAQAEQASGRRRARDTRSAACVRRPGTPAAPRGVCVRRHGGRGTAKGRTRCVRVRPSVVARAGCRQAPRRVAPVRSAAADTAASREAAISSAVSVRSGARKRSA